MKKLIVLLVISFLLGSATMAQQKFDKGKIYQYFTGTTRELIKDSICSISAPYWDADTFYYCKDGMPLKEYYYYVPFKYYIDDICIQTDTNGNIWGKNYDYLFKVDTALRFVHYNEINCPLFYPRHYEDFNFVIDKKNRFWSIRDSFLMKYDGFNSNTPYYKFSKRYTIKGSFVDYKGEAWLNLGERIIFIENDSINLGYPIEILTNDTTAYCTSFVVDSNFVWFTTKNQANIKKLYKFNKSTFQCSIAFSSSVEKVYYNKMTKSIYMKSYDKVYKYNGNTFNTYRPKIIDYNGDTVISDVEYLHIDYNNVEYINANSTFRLHKGILNNNLFIMLKTSYPSLEEILIGSSNKITLFVENDRIKYLEIDTTKHIKYYKNLLENVSITKSTNDKYEFLKNRHYQNIVIDYNTGLRKEFVVNENQEEYMSFKTPLFDNYVYWSNEFYDENTQQTYKHYLLRIDTLGNYDKYNYWDLLTNNHDYYVLDMVKSGNKIYMLIKNNGVLVFDISNMSFTSINSNYPSLLTTEYTDIYKGVDDGEIILKSDNLVTTISNIGVFTSYQLPTMPNPEYCKIIVIDNDIYCYPSYEGKILFKIVDNNFISIQDSIDCINNYLHPNISYFSKRKNFWIDGYLKLKKYSFLDSTCSIMSSLVNGGYNINVNENISGWTIIRHNTISQDYTTIYCDGNCDYDFAAGIPKTGFENSTINTLSVYPNPTTSQLTIRTKQLTNKTVEIYNSIGVLIRKIVVTDDMQDANNTSETMLDVSSLASGVYVCKAGQENIKFVKE